ncbi:hypothetical protein QFC22_000185 [Naganishia vaughanmartiniae]|uniref:Uncharacterized protein n=1 Tax=Naganishia vaughanmartiniae TaxID=1424756 RepID=A0ACC2XMD4_9TREE|nr:hypothetical protein QFC22_000185 [Naganishia vaughanmartiniae]
MSQTAQDTPSRSNDVTQQPHTPLSALSKAFPPDIHSVAEDITLDLSAAGSPANTAMTPGRPIFDSSSPFVAKPMNTPSYMFLPTTVDNRMRAKLFGQGLDGGFLVSPMTAGVNSTIKKHAPSSSLRANLRPDPRIYSEDNEDPFGEESMQSLGWSSQPLSTPIAEGNRSMFGTGVGLGVGLTEVDGINNASGAASPMIISTPSKYPSSLGAGVAPLLRNRSRMLHPQPPAPSESQQVNRMRQEEQQQHTTYLNLPAASAMQHSLSASATLQQHGLGPYQQAGSQFFPKVYPNTTDPTIAKVKAPLTLSQVPKRQKLNRTAMSRSLSMNNAGDSAPSSAFTHQPLARLPSRNLPSSSLSEESAAVSTPESPQLFPIGAGKTIYTSRNVSIVSTGSTSTQLSTGAPTFTSKHQDCRNGNTYDASTQSTLDTPILEYSLASPAFSVYGQSPWLNTPAIGPDASSAATNSLQFQQSTYAPFAAGSGLAIQMPHGVLPLEGPPSWHDGQPVSHFAGYTQPPVGHNQEMRVVTPMSHGFDYSNQYQPLIYAPPMGISYMPYPAQASGYWLMSSGPGVESQGPPPTAFSVVPDNVRHVSTPYILGDNAFKGEAGRVHMARSMSHGYLPVVHQASYMQSFGAESLAVIPGPSLPIVPSLCGGSQRRDSQPPPPVSKSMINTMMSIGEEAESSTPGDPKSKRVKHPAVGKRLRPGPRPKLRRREDPETVDTPQSDVNQVGGAATTSTPLVCKVELDVALPSATDGQQIFPTRQHPPSTTKRHHPYGSATSLSKEFLESCYSPLMVVGEGPESVPCKRYRCNIDNCGRIFPRKSAIHSHVQTHLEDKPFVCTEPECNAAFVRQHDLRRHARIHLGTKPFQCPCGKGFARGDALMRHRQRGICDGSVVPQRDAQRNRSKSREVEGPKVD